VLGSTSGNQTVIINSPTTVNAAVTATGPITAAAVSATSLTVSGNTVLGTNSSQTVTINAATNLDAAVTATAPVTATAVTVTGTLTATGLLNVSGDAILGSSTSDYVTILGTTTFVSPVAFESDVTFPNGTTVTASSDTTLGTTAEDLLLVNAAATFTSGLQVDDELSVNNFLTVAGDTVLGNSSSDELIVNAAATFTGPFYLYDGSTVPSVSAVLDFQRQLGTGPVTTGSVLGAVLFTGWDGATYGTGAQIESVFTVSC